MDRSAENIATFLKDNPLSALTKQDAKSAAAFLKNAAKDEPALQQIIDHGGAPHEFAVAAMSLSPYLREIAELNPALLTAALTQPIDQQLEEIIARAREAWWPDPDVQESAETALMNQLRLAKRQASFVIAMADLARLFGARETTLWLSRLAEACVSAAVDFLLLSLADSGKIEIADRERPSHGSGVVVLGMGKLGACELNYSSDIDLVIFYEPAAGLADVQELPDIFARACRRLLRILQERTAYGYVFRTDLRLRPDPGSTPLAIPVEAAYLYYESRGQNWERAAYIKARPVGGDIDAGHAFLRELVPFIYRKYLDYAAISDIHSIKRQIHAHRGLGEIAVKQHNVKLGRGGIREVEFFVQTQQLIAGGRMPELRVSRTDEALAGLANAGWIGREVADELTAAYWFLRDVEHRIQMVRDEQSHELPASEAELKRIAFMLGFNGVKSFSDQLISTLRTVELRYAHLFEQESGLSRGTGNLVFTGDEDDPGTLATLKELGFERPADIARTVRTWHYGRYRSTQSAEAREQLTELTPQLLEVFGASKRADEALLRFDQFIAGLPAGIQLFSLLGKNPGLLSMLVLIMSAAPRAAAIIAARPHVFDGMLDPTLMQEIPTRQYLAERLATFLGGSRYYEDVLDRLRIFAAEQRFLIGIRLLTGTVDAWQAARAFSDLADLAIEAALNAVADEMELAHGKMPGGRVAVAAMGKLGSREMTAGSDVDLIVLYDHDADAQESDGPKPLDPGRYFARLTQRLMAALSSPTAEGILYEVDLRLRPSGNKGPVATRINAFDKYQREEAWTWEHMALARCRIVCGDEHLVAEAQRIISEIIMRQREQAAIAVDVGEMRTLIDKEKPPESKWDMKLIAGGLIDLEFIAQYMALMAHSRGHKVGELSTSTRQVLLDLGPHFMAEDALATLVNAHDLYSHLSQILRFCSDGVFEPNDSPAGLNDLLCRAANCPDLKSLEGTIKRQAKQVRKILEKLLS